MIRSRALPANERRLGVVRFFIGMLFAMPLMAAAQSYGVAQPMPGEDPSVVWALEDLTVEQIKRALAPSLPGERGYLPRSTHPVNAEDLAVCPEWGGATREQALGLTRGGASIRHVPFSLEFDNNSIALGEKAREGLKKFALALQSPELNRSRYVIEGHANRTGTAAYNHRLTCERAANIRTFLREQGVSAERVMAVGFGFEQPLPNVPPPDARNRRAVVRLLN
jgi:outer membrane protein OmpA-like peptidoglycan-associated protein